MAATSPPAPPPFAATSSLAVLLAALLAVLTVGCADSGRSRPESERRQDTPDGSHDSAPASDGDATPSVDLSTADAGLDARADAECRSHEHCDDDNPCTTDLCDVAGICQHLEVGGPCDDGDPCTERDECSASTCEGRPVVCPDLDSDPCVAEVCTRDLGCVSVCRDTPDCLARCEDDAACDDGDPESVDTCVISTCSASCAHVWPSCDDDNPCTDDRPDETGACRNIPRDGLDCDDGSDCTEGDGCVGGRCLGDPVVCDDGNPCTADRCRTGRGCVYEELPDGVVCDDGNACTRNDECAGAECVGAPHDCPEDDDGCSIEYCDPQVGCQVFCRQKEDCAPGCEVDADCDDGDPCSVDSCEATLCTTRCVYHPEPCDDGDPCTADYCDVAVGGCRHVEWCRTCDPIPSEDNPSPDDQCEDGRVCTLDRCLPDGLCEENVALTCPDDGDPCTEERCEEPVGCTWTCRNDCGAPCVVDADCDDGDACTVDTCESGTCGSTCRHTARTCTADRPCATSLCAAGGCITSVPAALPALNGSVDDDDDWHPASTAAVELDPSDWPDAALEELRVQVGDNLIYVGIRGYARRPDQAVIGYLDVDLGSSRGLTRVGDLRGGVGALDAALIGCASFGAAGFHPDFAFGTVAMSSAFGTAENAGWRRFTSSGSLRWMPEGAVVAGDGIEAAVTLTALLPDGVPAAGAAMGLVVLVTDTTPACTYADQSLPDQPASLTGPSPRILAVYRFVAQPALVECCSVAADCRDDDPCTSDLCPPDGRCVHLPNGCAP